MKTQKYQHGIALLLALIMLIPLAPASFASTRYKSTPGIGLLYTGDEYTWDENKEGAILQKDNVVYVPIKAVIGQMKGTFEATEDKSGFKLSLWQYDVSYTAKDNVLTVVTKASDDFDRMLYVDRYADEYVDKGINPGNVPGTQKIALKPAPFIQNGIWYVPGDVFFNAIGMETEFIDIDRAQSHYAINSTQVFFRAHYYVVLDPSKYEEKDRQRAVDRPLVMLARDLGFDKLVEKHFSPNGVKSIGDFWIRLGSENTRYRFDITSWALDPYYIEFDLSYVGFADKGVNSIVEEALQVIVPDPSDAAEIYAHALRQYQEGPPKTLVGWHEYPFTAKNGTQYSITLSTISVSYVLRVNINPWDFIPKDPSKRKVQTSFQEHGIYEYLSKDKDLVLRYDELTKLIVYDKQRNPIITIVDDRNKPIALHPYFPKTQKHVDVITSVFNYYAFSVEEGHKLMQAYLRMYLDHENYYHYSSDFVTEHTFEKSPYRWTFSSPWSSWLLIERNQAKSVKQPTEEEKQALQSSVDNYFLILAQDALTEPVVSATMDFSLNRPLVQVIERYKKEGFITRFSEFHPSGAYADFMIYESNGGITLAIKGPLRSSSEEQYIKARKDILTALVGKKAIADDILKVLLECATEEYYFGARLKPNPEGYITQNGTTFHMVDRTNRVHPVFYIVIKK